MSNGEESLEVTAIGTLTNASNASSWTTSTGPSVPFRDPPTKVSLLEVFVWFPTSEIMVLSQQALQVGTRVSPKWGSYRGESNRM
jgi:hypothetical protein